MTLSPGADARSNRQAALSIIRKLHQSGYEAYLVGGCVRDMLLKKKPSDFDVTTSATPDQVERLFSRTIPVGKQFGVMIVLKGRSAIEVATFRKDSGYSDGRRPDSVTYSSAEEDALRRDFTVNGLYYDPIRKKVLDWVGGQDDLRNKVIRTIGSPGVRFEEDKLRMIRAARFAANLGFEISSGTMNSIRKLSAKIRDVSRERIREEFQKMLTRSRPDVGVQLMIELKLLENVFFQTDQLQKRTVVVGRKKLKLSDLICLVLKKASIDRFETGFAVLIRFIAACEIKNTHFNDAEAWIEELNHHTLQNMKAYEQLCSLMKLSNDEKRLVTDALRIQCLLYRSKTMPISEMKRLLRSDATSTALILFKNEEKSVLKSQKRFDAICKQTADWKKKDFFPKILVTGDDLCSLGYDSGPIIGKILKAIETERLENRLKSKKQILQWVSKTFPQNNSR